MSSDFEDRVVAATLTGEEVSGPGEIRGALVREILTGLHGPPHWNGLRLSEITVRGDVDLSYCEWRGRLKIADSDIDGDVILTYAKGGGAVVLDRSRMGSVDAGNAELNGSLQIRRALIRRGLSGVGMQVHGVLNLVGSTVVAPRDKPNRAAVGLYRAKIDDLYMTNTVLVGGFFGNGLTVRRNLRLSGVQARSRVRLGLDVGPDTLTGAAISLLGAQVGGAIYLHSEALKTAPPRIDGSLVLTRATCDTLRARPVDVAYADLSVEYFTYSQLHGMTGAQWLEVLEQEREVGSQPYRQLALICDSTGDFDTAREARIALQRRLDRDGSNRGWRALQRQSLRWTVAYGYRPGRAVLWLLLVSLVAAAILISFDDFIVSAEDGAAKAERGFGSTGEAVSFAIDSLVPFANIGVTGQWTVEPKGTAQIAALSMFVLLKGMAWALAALALAATTGLVRKE